jgi:hypothetical protein
LRVARAIDLGESDWGFGSVDGAESPLAFWIRLIDHLLVLGWGQRRWRQWGGHDCGDDGRARAVVWRDAWGWWSVRKASTPSLLEESWVYTTTVFRRDESPEVDAVGVVDAAETVFIDRQVVRLAIETRQLFRAAAVARGAVV